MSRKGREGLWLVSQIHYCVTAAEPSSAGKKDRDEKVSALEKESVWEEELKTEGGKVFL